MVTFGFWGRHQSQADFLLNLFLSLPSCLPSQFLLLLLCEVNSECHWLFCVYWTGKREDNNVTNTTGVGVKK